MEEGGEVLPPPETVNHLVFGCPAYTEAREELLNKIGQDSFNLPDIMSEVKCMKALTTFINRSGQFRT